MAVDTRQKRLSAAFPLIPFINHNEPAGTIDQDNRQAIAFTYSGILADSPLLGAAIAVYSYYYRLRNRGINV